MKDESNDVDAFFERAAGKIMPADLDSILKLAVECSVYFNDHKSTLEALAVKLTHLIDAVYPRNKSAVVPSRLIA